MDRIVVYPIGFNDRRWTGLFPRTEKLHVVEKYRRVDFGHLEVDVTCEDAVPAWMGSVCTPTLRFMPKIGRDWNVWRAIVRGPQLSWSGWNLSRMAGCSIASSGRGGMARRIL